jgi:hypothetical protein
MGKNVGGDGKKSGGWIEMWGGGWIEMWGRG